MGITKGVGVRTERKAWKRGQYRLNGLEDLLLGVELLVRGTIVPRDRHARAGS